MIAVDTNLLVYAHRAGAREHVAARRAIERAANSPAGWGVSVPCLVEFWSVVTHPRQDRPSTSLDAVRFVRSLVHDAEAQVWLPTAGFPDRLMALASERHAAGPRVFDLQIALMAFEGGAREVWTHDRDFVTVPGLRVHDPIHDSG